MTTWQETLRAAATVVPGLDREMERVIELIQRALLGTIDETLLREVLGPVDEHGRQHEAPVVAALDAAGHAAGADSIPAATLDALWDTLRELPSVLRLLDQTGPGTSPPLEGIYSVPDHLRRMIERPTAPDVPSAQCPRCRSAKVSFHWEKFDGVKFVEIACRRCGLLADFNYGDPGLDAWRKPEDGK